jgi:membrane protease YdiL (CAAX protease family)
LKPPLGFVIAWTVFGLFTFLALGGTAQMVQLAWGLWFSEVIVFAGMAFIGWRLLQLAPAPVMGVERFDGKGLALGFAFGAVNYFAWAVPLMAAAQAIFPKSWVERFDSSQVFDRASTADLVVVLVGVSLAAPIGEELFFRGFMQRGLGFQVGGPRAIVVTAVIFSAFHLDPVGLTARFELGVLFGLLAWRAGSIWPAMGAHAANNFISSLLFLGAGDRTEEDLVWWIPVVLFVVGNIALVALVRFAGDALRAPVSARLVAEKRENPAKIFAPWVLAGIAAVALVVALDWRGMKLNLLDVSIQPGELRKNPEVKELRAKVRRGEAEFAEYEALVTSLK